MVVVVACGSATSESAMSTSAHPTEHVGTTASTTPETTSTTSRSSASTATAPSATIVDGEWFDFALDLTAPGVRDLVAVVWRNGLIEHEMIRSRSGKAGLDSRFRLASLSKTITATAVLTLVERGRLRLDDRPLVALAATSGNLPLDPSLADTTIAQLLSHTSGIDTFRRDFFESPGTTADELVGRILASPAAADAGREFLYSNANYLLLGRVIEMITGEDDEVFVRREILAPLGILGLRYGSTGSNETGDADHFSGPERNYMELLEAAGAWIGSARETLRFMSALANGEIVDSTTLDAMRRPVSGPTDEDWSYASGIIVWNDGSWGHTGSLESARSLALVRPDGTIVVVLVNGDEPMASGDLVSAVESGLAGPPVDVGSNGRLAP